MPNLCRNLKRVIESHGFADAFARFNEAIEKKDIDPLRDFSLKEAAVSLMGDDWDEKLYRYNIRAVREASEGVDASQFAHITGQLLVNEIKQKYDDAEFIGDQLFTTVPINNGNLGTQRMPGLSKGRNNVKTVQPGMPYPQTDFREEYVDLPGPAKFGEICQVTMEMVDSDLTGQALESAGDVGRAVRMEKEERQLRVVLGIDTANFTWNGTTYSPYYLASDSQPWTNKLTSVTFDDFQKLNNLEQLLAQMRDPLTNKSINVKANTLLVMPEAKYNAKHVLRSTTIETGKYDASNVVPRQISGNVIDEDYTILTSKHARRLLVDESSISATNVFYYTYLGDFKRGLVWRQYKPFQTFEAPAGNPLEFYQDIALAIKAREAGVAAWKDPRYVAFQYNS